ncbi:AEC family transporter [Cellulomonas bogoriensis]|uniref:Membrane protein n=1 Tax=Cellulomonas bogoriensis 69B4 = DSM 16987 TaxID=1386082 RepID=A0A0A0BZX6_9CELL|nr:AEC family transporter [Cellulomonas bogoriensis]KGM13500.1 membrane protein [Cellulomonas bogoriensis 69B4 = DSM 16987]
MGAVATALGTLVAIAVIGWLLGRFRLLGVGAEQVLARTVFAIAVPSLLMVTIAHADLHRLLSRLAVVTALSTAVVVAAAVLVTRLAWRRPAGETTVVALASSYVNAGNLGIPVAVYLLGDPVFVVPTLLFQLLVLAPVAFAVLDSRPVPQAGTSPVMPPPRRGPVRATTAVLGRTLKNPIIIGALSGLVLAALPWDLPEVVYEPFRLLGAAAAPLALLTFGMSLALPRTPGQEAPVKDLALVVGLRSFAHPVLAAGIGLALGLEGQSLLAVVTMASLPTAQNVLVYALQYGQGQALARDAGVVTTLLALPVMLLVAALLT